MANPKCQFGDVVTALGIKVLERGIMMAEFPATWEHQVIFGMVCGKGTGRKVKVGWTLMTRSVLDEH